MSALKLGTDTGSVINHLQSRMTLGAPEPVVGMGATVLHWTDRSPATVTRVYEIKGVTHIEIKGDHYKRTDKNGMSESQDYDYTPNPDAYPCTYRREPQGGWVRVIYNAETKRWRKSKDGGLVVGRREKYHDFSF